MTTRGHRCRAEQASIPVETDEPRYVVAQIQTHSHCNADCLMCPYGITSRMFDHGRMEWDLFTNIVDDIVTLPSLRSVVVMLQNEPLLDTRICDAIRYVKRQRADTGVALATNGALLDRAMLDDLMSAGLDELCFSINALTKETFEVVEKGLSFEVVMANLRGLIEYNPPGLSFFVKFLIIRQNQFELSFSDRFSDIVALARSRDIPIVMKPISNRAGSLKNYHELLVYEQGQGSKAKTYCDDVFESLNILHNGDVIGCCADWLRKSVIGSFRESTLREIWEGDRARAFRRAITEGRYAETAPCRDCNQAWNIMEHRRTGP